MTFTRDEHEAIEGRPPFDLRDVVVLADGVRLRGTRARIYDLLRQTAERRIRHRIGAELGPEGWVPNYYLRKAWSGGNAGDRRLRELREKYGVEIEQGAFDTRKAGCGGCSSRTVLWRWVCDRATETRPFAQNGLMGGFQTETKGAGPQEAAEGSAGVFGRLRFWTAVGNPGDLVPGATNLAPHQRHPLALPGWVFSGVVGGRMSRERALEEYVRHLRKAWVNGNLRELLGSGGELVFWVTPEHAATIETFPTLVEALTRCGAEYLGEWKRDEGRAA